MRFSGLSVHKRPEGEGFGSGTAHSGSLVSKLPRIQKEKTTNIQPGWCRQGSCHREGEICFLNVKRRPFVLRTRMIIILTVPFVKLRFVFGMRHRLPRARPAAHILAYFSHFFVQPMSHLLICLYAPNGNKLLPPSVLGKNKNKQNRLICIKERFIFLFSWQ